MVQAAAEDDPDQGYFVAQVLSSGNVEMIDVNTTCDTGYVQHLYAGCSGDGCLVREGLNPSSNQYWDFILEMGLGIVALRRALSSPAVDRYLPCGSGGRGTATA